MKNTRNRLHVCRSNDFGQCGPCLAFPGRLLTARGSVTTETLETLTGAERRRIGRKAIKVAAQNAKREALALAAAQAAQAVADAAEREARRKRGAAAHEAEKAARGAAARKAKAAKRERIEAAARIAAQAALIALRVSQDATWRVFVLFAHGTHEVSAARPVETPEGVRWLTEENRPVLGRETRVSRKVRGDAPGIRFGGYQGAELIRDGQAKAFAAKAPGRKVGPTRRRRRG
jgi:hypothetical protein